MLAVHGNLCSIDALLGCPLALWDISLLEDTGSWSELPGESRAAAVAAVFHAVAWLRAVIGAFAPQVQLCFFTNTMHKGHTWALRQAEPSVKQCYFVRVLLLIRSAESVALTAGVKVCAHRCNCLSACMTQFKTKPVRVVLKPHFAKICNEMALEFIFMFKSVVRYITHASYWGLWILGNTAVIMAQPCVLELGSAITHQVRQTIGAGVVCAVD